MHSRFSAEILRYSRIYLLSAVVVSIRLVRAGDAWDTSSIRLAIAIRYLQIHGVSHSQIYLYRGDGKLLRQLTHDEAGQDRDPIFSSDGSEVVFRKARNTGDEFWLVNTDGAGLRRLDRAPDWYAQAIAEKPQRFDYPPFVPLPRHPDQQRLSDYVKAGEVVYAAPDNSVAIVLSDRLSEADPAQDWYPKDLSLRDSQNQTDLLISKLPFVSLEESSTRTENSMRRAAGGGERYETKSENGVGPLDGVLVCNGSPFLFVGHLRVAFLRQHRGSTFCEGFFALDIDARRLHELIPNCGDIIPLKDRPVFFCICNERYLPLGDGKRTVNCSFLDLWAADFKRIRFSKPQVAEYYGCSVFQPGGAPAVTVIREQE